MYRPGTIQTPQRSHPHSLSGIEKRSEHTIIGTAIIPPASPAEKPSIEITALDRSVLEFVRELAPVADKHLFGDGLALVPKEWSMNRAAAAAFKAHPFDISKKVGGNIIDDQETVVLSTPQGKRMAVFVSTGWSAEQHAYVLKARFVESIVASSGTSQLLNWLNSTEMIKYAKPRGHMEIPKTNGTPAVKSATAVISVRPGELGSLIRKQE